MLIVNYLTWIGQVGIPGEHEGARQDYIEAAEGLDAIKDGQVSKIAPIEVLRVHGLSLLIRLHVHLVYVSNS